MIFGYRSRELLPGQTTEIRQRVTWRSDSKPRLHQTSLENKVLKSLGLEAPTASESLFNKRQSTRALGSSDPRWPTPTIWRCWAAQNTRAADESLSSGTATAVDIALVWQASPLGTLGSTAICDIEIPPHHSPLLPTLSNLLKVDKASTRAMYEETNTRRRQLLTDVLTGEAALEDNPLRVTVEYVPPAREPGVGGPSDR